MKKSIQLAALLSMLLGFGQPVQVYGQQPQNHGSISERGNSVKSDNELLQGGLTAIREYHSSLLDTVYWSLGLVFGLVLLIIGSSWYSNFRLYEADKARLLEEAERKIAEANSRISRDLQMLSSNLSDKVDRDTVALTNRLSTEIERMRSDNKDAERKISSDLKELEEALGLFLKITESIGVQLNRTSLDTQLNTERIWELKGNPIKVLLAQFLGLDGAVRAGNPNSIKACLERMKDNLSSSVLPSGKKIPSSVLEALQRTLVHIRDNGPAGDDPIVIDLSLVAEVAELLEKVATTDPN
jgi:hypothetical protein